MKIKKAPLSGESLLFWGFDWKPLRPLSHQIALFSPSAVVNTQLHHINKFWEQAIICNKKNTSVQLLLLFCFCCKPQSSPEDRRSSATRISPYCVFCTFSKSEMKTATVTPSNPYDRVTKEENDRQAHNLEIKAIFRQLREVNTAASEEDKFCSSLKGCISQGQESCDRAVTWYAEAASAGFIALPGFGRISGKSDCKKKYIYIRWHSNSIKLNIFNKKAGRITCVNFLLTTMLLLYERKK